MHHDSRGAGWLVLFLSGCALTAGLACGGGGGGGRVPESVRLPDGDLYLWSEQRQSFVDTTFFPDPYVKVDAGLDESFYINEYGNRAPLDLLQFGFSQFGEDGFILTVETGTAGNRRTAARLSVALAPVSINFGEETIEFIRQDPLQNAGIVFDIMERITSGLGFSLLSPWPGGKIVSGGAVTRVEKDGTKEYFDAVYEDLVAEFSSSTGLPPRIIRAQFPRSSLEQYLSGLAYQSGYSGGAQTLLSQFFERYRDAEVWAGNGYFVELRLDSLAIPGLASLASASGNLSAKRPLPPVPAVVPPIFAAEDRVYADTNVRYMAVPQRHWWREAVVTHQADAGWPADETLLSLTLYRDATVFVAVDKRLPPPAWLGGWTLTGEAIITSDEQASPMPIWEKEWLAGEGYIYQGKDATCALYIPFVSAGEFNLVAEVTVKSHAVVMEDNPSAVVSMRPAIRQEGGIVVNANGITVDPETGFPLVHVDFVEEFDANALLDTEANVETSLDEISPAWFVTHHLLRNNGFRLIDTYNDRCPVFGAGSQVVQIENFLGISVGDEPIRMVLDAADLQIFTNFNLLNSPNLVGINLKAIGTDDPNLEGQIWKDSEADRGLNLAVLEAAIEGAEGFSFFYTDPGSPVTLKELLQRVGKSEEGEVSFGVRVALPGGYRLDLRGGMYCHDYFTNVYDSVLPGQLPLPFRATPVSPTILPSLI